MSQLEKCNKRWMQENHTTSNKTTWPLCCRISCTNSRTRRHLKCRYIHAYIHTYIHSFIFSVNKTNLKAILVLKKEQLKLSWSNISKYWPIKVSRKMCHSYQNVLQLEKYATARKINTVIKICPN